jgi:hypothetical protein
VQYNLAIVICAFDQSSQPNMLSKDMNML